MLDEGHRRAERGTDVVVGLRRDPRPAAHRGDARGPRGRAAPRRSTTAGSTFDGDGPRRRARAPARRSRWSTSSRTPTCPGSRNEKRWQDVDELLDAGIDVITTVNIQHLESLNDVVEQITGVRAARDGPRRTWCARADQIELVDMARRGAAATPRPRQRLPGRDRIDAALSNYFRVGNLTALRELALLWLADRVDEGLERYRASTASTATWEARERIVVALTGGPEGETLIRRGARIAAPVARGDLLAVHVARLTTDSPAPTRARSHGQRPSSSTRRHLPPGRRRRRPAALLDFARAENATQLVIGVSRRDASRPAVSGARHRRDRDPRVRRHRRAHRHPRRRGPGHVAAPRPRQPQHPAQAAGLRRWRCPAAAAC